MELLIMGWRNLRRNPRRSVLNVLAIAIGTAIMIISIAWVRGYFTSLYEGIIELDTGHAQVLAEGYREEERRLPLDIAIGDYEALRTTLLEHEVVETIAARITFSAQLGNGRRATRLTGRGIEPSEERVVTVLENHIRRGRYPDNDEAGVLLNDALAGRLEPEPGDPVFITALDRNGAENFLESQLVGTFALGYPAIDDNLFFVDLASAQRLLAMDDEVTRLVLRMDSGPSVARHLERLRSSVERLEGGESDVELYPWRSFVEVIVSAVEADIAGFSMILGVLFLLIIVGILNSMSMTVHERRREIGTLRAIGMRRNQLTTLFIAEGASIAIIGSAVGVVLAGIAGIYFGVIGFDLSVLAETGLPVPFGERFTADFRVWDFFLGTGIALVTATAGSVLPTRRALRLSIAGALGSHLE
ncbi:MAG: ABC transporter permease [Spirochaetota bacterium]